MRLLLIFLKEPIPGQVKTRLAADIGEEEAARYYKALVEVLLRQLHGLSQTHIRFCYAPDDAEDAIRFWLLPAMNAQAGKDQSTFLAPDSPTDEELRQKIDFQAQGDGDLGQRIDRAFSRGFDDGFKEIAVIGSDCPDCGSRWINMAFARLQSESRDAVIGPCHDGGYYLLALKSHRPELFANIPWSSQEVMTATRKAATQTNLTLEELPPLADIDHPEDWQRLMASPLAAAVKKALGETLDEEVF